MSIHFESHDLGGLYKGSPFPIAGFCRSERIRAYLSVGDTVRVQDGDDALSFIGRIVNVKDKCRTIKTSNIHPEANQTEVMFLIQKYLCENELHGKDLAQRSHELQLSANGVREAAESNLVVWVSANQVDSIVFLIHEEDFLNHTYGSLAGRENCFFVRYKAIHGGNGSCVFSRLTREEYRTFGPTTGTQCGCESYTERMLIALMHECDISKSILNRQRKMTSPNKSLTTSKSKEAWHFFKMSLNFLSATSKRTKRKREVTNMDLSIASCLYDSNIETVMASSQEEFDECRSILSSLYGIGIRKRFPTRANIDNRQLNPSQLMLHDTINMIDLPMEEGLELDTDIDEAKFYNVGNHIKWQWNPVTRLCTVTIRCMPLVVSSHARALVEFLERFQVNIDNWVQEEVDGLFVGAALFRSADGRRFEVQSINGIAQTTTLLDVMDQTTINISIDECNDSFELI